jgi:2-methylcitrate dehydratase PrpD
VLALAERDRRSGLDMMVAYQVGVEVECKVAEAIAPRHYQTGFHSTATCGSIGAAEGAAKLLGLDREATRRAISIGATQAGGLRENFGTMTKPFHAGRAAENGVVAAEIAALGFTASPNGLEADRGFFRAAGGGYDANAIEGKLGDPWTFHYPGVSIKPHPSGSLTHPGMGAMLELIRKHDVKPGEVKRVSVGANHNMPNALIHHQPKNELQAKFSMEFCMAILLLERKGSLQEFTDDVVNRADVQAMIRKVSFGVHPEAEAAGFDKMTTIIEVELDGGRVLRTRADFGKGSPANPMSDAELSEKFRECAAWRGLDKARIEEIVKLAWKIEELLDVNDLTKLLRQ